MASRASQDKQHPAAAATPAQDVPGVEQKVTTWPTTTVKPTGLSRFPPTGPGVPVVVAHYITIDGIDRRPGDEITVNIDLARSLVHSGQARYVN
jgi:hypothetical protein